MSPNSGNDFGTAVITANMAAEEQVYTNLIDTHQYPGTPESSTTIPVVRSLSFMEGSGKYAGLNIFGLLMANTPHSKSASAIFGDWGISFEYGFLQGALHPLTKQTALPKPIAIEEIYGTLGPKETIITFAGNASTGNMTPPYSISASNVPFSQTATFTIHGNTLAQLLSAWNKKV